MNNGFGLFIYIASALECLFPKQSTNRQGSFENL